MSKSFADMGKVELRAACKLAGVQYGKLNNDGMRAALEAKQAEQGIGSAGSDGVPRPLDPRVSADVKKAEQLAKLDPVKVAATIAAVAKVVETPVVEAPVIRETTLGTVVKAKSLKIEKVRDEQNKVRRPSAGSICRSIWDALDAKRTETKAVPTFEMLRELMKAHNWSRNTAMTQYQRWKQFNGVMPRTVDAEEVDVESQDE